MENKSPCQIYMVPTSITESVGASFFSEDYLLAIQMIQVWFVENERTTRRFLSSLKIGITIESLILQVIDAQTPEKEIISFIEKHQILHTKIGVMSESGCPGIADPGANVAKVAHKLGLNVIPLLGPSSIFLSLMASGLNGQNFAFQGYLPIQKEELKVKIKKLEQESTKNKTTQIFIETPYRNKQIFDTLLEVCAENTSVCVAIDITGNEEYIQTKKVKEWKKTEVIFNKTPTVFLFLAEK